MENVTISVCAGKRVRPGMVSWSILSLALLSLPVANLIGGKPRPVTDYEADLERIENDIGVLEETASSAPIAVDKAVRFAYRLYHRASLTASAADFEAAETALDEALRRIGPIADLYLLRAHLNFRLHRLAEAARDLEMLSSLADSAEVMALKAGIAFQAGRYDAAKRGYGGAIERSPTWDNLARLASWESKFGDPERADGLYRQAQEEISAKEMRSYAWVELQRGLLDLRRGRYEEAMVHYRAAGRAYSGFWLVEEHIAELLAAQRRFDEAIVLYEQAIARAPRPELQQALGDLYLLTGKLEPAKRWHEKALAGYLDSARRGEVRYFHHLAEFFADVRQDGGEALRWARKDHELRPNFATQESLAWALYRNSDFAEALHVIKTALSSGAKDAHLFFRAGMIHLAAGESDKGIALLQQAAVINPRHEEFHVHR